jgi:hypothetical protein
LVGTAINTLSAVPYGPAFVYILAAIIIISGVMMVLGGS